MSSNTAYNKRTVTYFPQYPQDKIAASLAYDTPILFDRIINVRLFRSELDPVTHVSSEAMTLANSVTVRSDYEAVFVNASGKETATIGYRVKFIRCKQKPSLSLKAMFYKGSVSPKVTLSIDNFSIDSSNGTLYSLDRAQRPFTYAEIHIGYINQFYDWESSLEIGTGAYQKYLELGNDRSSVTVIKGSILNCKVTKQPPDSRIEFEIVPASLSAGVPDIRLFSPPYSSYTGTSFVKDLYKSAMTYKDFYTGKNTSAADFASAASSKGIPTFTQNLFYYLISLRFYASEYYAGEDAASRAERLSTYVQNAGSTDTPGAKGIASLKALLTSDTTALGAVSFFPDDAVKASGYLRVIVGARSMMFAIPGEIAQLLKSGASERKIKTAIASYATIWDISPEAVMNEIQATMFPTLSFSLGMIKASRAAPRVQDMGIHSQSDGAVQNESCLFVYDGNSPDDLAATYVPDVYNASNLNNDVESTARTMFIPCINSLTYGAVSVAIMPFCGTYPITSPVSFDKAYTLADEIKYYAPNRQGTGVFLAYQMDINFATVDDENEVTLTMDTTKEILE